VNVTHLNKTDWINQGWPIEWHCKNSVLLIRFHMHNHITRCVSGRRFQPDSGFNLMVVIDQDGFAGFYDGQHAVIKTAMIQRCIAYVRTTCLFPMLIFKLAKNILSVWKSRYPLPVNQSRIPCVHST